MFNLRFSKDNFWGFETCLRTQHTFKKVLDINLLADIPEENPPPSGKLYAFYII